MFKHVLFAGCFAILLLAAKNLAAIISFFGWDVYTGAAVILGLTIVWLTSGICVYLVPNSLA